MSFDGPIPNVEGSFHLDCPSGTDIWDKPPSTHDFNGPFIHKIMPLSSFTSLRITVTASWTYQYDQGGILVLVKSKDGVSRWIKSGVELLDGVPRVGTVAKDNWSDWSLSPLTAKDGKTATVEFEAGPGKALWVRLVGENGEKTPLREVTWWAALDEDAEVLAGVYTAKPSKEGDLRVEFRDLKLVTL